MATIKENNGDASADAGTDYKISLGDIFQGTLDPAGDKDWVSVELTAGTIYDFTLSGVYSAEYYADFALFDSSGYQIVTSLEARIIFKPDDTGTYYIHVGSFDDDFSGDYELSLVENTIPVGTYDEIADYLTDDHWEARGETRRAFDVAPGGVLTANITALTEEGQQLARWALEAWTNVTGIQFELVDDDDAHISFDDNEVGAFAGSTVVDGVIISSRVNVSTDYFVEDLNTIGGSTFPTYIHEIGHALGLGHPGPYIGEDTLWGRDIIFLNDSSQATVLSYFSQENNTYIDADYALPVTPMIADIIAIQNLYGTPADINLGDTIYGYQSNLDGYLGEFFRLWTGETNPFSSIDMTGTHLIKPRLVDLDSDGDADLVVGNNTGLLYYFENTGTSSNPGFTERTGTANPLDGIDVGSYSTPTFSDLDGDGDYDLVIGNRNGDIAYFENAGTGTSPRFAQRSGANNPFDSITMGSFSTVALADLDGDSDHDLVIGVDDGVVQYYENTGTSTNADFVLRTGENSPLNNINTGPESTPVFVDFDGDNDSDLVIGYSGVEIFYFENTGTTTDAIFTQRTNGDNPFHAVRPGFYIAPDFIDLDGNGALDLIIGAYDGVIHYFKNTGTDADPDITPQTLLSPTTLTIYDNSGNDTLDLRTDKDNQRVDLRPEGISDVYGLTGNLIIARHSVIENFVAGSGNDRIAGNAVANHINGGDGNDRIWGSGGDDSLEGGTGTDRLEGGPGADMLDGGPGSDTASYQHSAAAVLVRLHNASAVRLGDAQGDTLVNIEHLVGSAHNDILAGDGGDNELRGGGGHDDLYGGPAGGDDMMYGDDGDDRLFGGRGDDTLTGGEGNDLLKGGPGEDILIADGDDMDVLYGGSGSDKFRFSPSNLGGGTIRDFSDGEDVIDLTEFTGVRSMDDLDIVEHGDNVRIEISGSDYLTTIILSDFDMSNLDNSDFLF